MITTFIKITHNYTSWYAFISSCLFIIFSLIEPHAH